MQRPVVFLFLPRAQSPARCSGLAAIGGGEQQKSAELERVRWGFDLTAGMEEYGGGGALELSRLLAARDWRPLEPAPDEGNRESQVGGTIENSHPK
jgi:hypothetical protein